METTKTFAFTKPLQIVLGLFFSLFLFTNSFQAQEITVKGIVKGKTQYSTEILVGANIFVKGTKEATSTNKKGEFSIAKKLKVGDVLVFSYLGYLKKELKISKATSFLNVILMEDENEMLGALQSKKRYRSKRTKQ